MGGENEEDEALVLLGNAGKKFSQAHTNSPPPPPAPSRELCKTSQKSL